MTQPLARLAPVVGRTALALVFVDGGWHVLQDPAGPARGAERLLGRIRSAVPPLGSLTDEQLVRANAAVHLGAGAALALGIAPRLAAGTLAASLVPTTLAVFAFWEQPAGPERGHARGAFLKNLAIAGGLLGLAARPSR